MRRLMIGLAVLTAALVAPAWGRDDKAAPEDEKLYGTWALTKVEFLDKAIPTPPEQEHTFAFAKGGKVTLKKNDKPAEAGSYKLGPVKTPREIDVTSPGTGDKKGETLKAIYELDGDTLKIAFPLAGPLGERPTAFDPKVAGIMTLKRQKP